MRIFYSLMWWLAMPLVLARLWLRGRKEPAYRQHWAERLGLYGRKPGGAMPMSIWVHAVSVGETRAAEPLVEALLAAWPECRIILTHMTPTGRATGQSLFARHGARLLQSYLPYDTATMVGRFIRHFEPRMCILMETEVWPNLIAVCHQRSVPVALVNARLSQRSLKRAQRLGRLMREAARGITLVAAQTEADAQRVALLGVKNVAVTGSIKFDVVVPDAALATGAWLRGLIGQRPVLLCASTRDGEEALILDAYQRATKLPADLLLLIVPRHPQRFEDVEKMIAARGLSMQRRSLLSDESQLAADVKILLGDSMGEMFAYYAACDCAFIGGSLLPLGGQNLIEACALGKPVLIGPHTFNFALVTQDALAAGAAALTQDADALMQRAAELLQDPAGLSDMGRHALVFASQHRGATQRTLALLPSLLNAKVPA
ncbi:lipid IV(A) 3-deoxy-D-manno-octulosonic acid transferase [Janthinobacterium agaricidamnosum]|uniref:3-deoxy-D-manno-octulosonic acid transferase n=1 Tax=Janthinobacterium agaricidamnosum NBRC 102515 = DSM 9628 TaxID=1349767 RepID=W0UY23_9BURK|nr:lipid IV(A) 3-deoxy-D-manno-octulosonic acid transferase [Janthinobacterium agaricidamnosum]CDG81449.1 3-Deoxy-D-manno-octulosonic-acid transferase family protein [Janthinobacterium agaricidamnosum NBRC 102515 = DSM 9628]